MYTEYTILKTIKCSHCEGEEKITSARDLDHLYAEIAEHLTLKQMEDITHMIETSHAYNQSGPSEELQMLATTLKQYTG